MVDLVAARHRAVKRARRNGPQLAHGQPRPLAVTNAPTVGSARQPRQCRLRRALRRVAPCCAALRPVPPGFALPRRGRGGSRQMFGQRHRSFSEIATHNDLPNRIVMFYEAASRRGLPCLRAEGAAAARRCQPASVPVRQPGKRLRAPQEALLALLPVYCALGYVAPQVNRAGEIEEGYRGWGWIPGGQPGGL